MASVTEGTVSETEGAITTDCVDGVWTMPKELGHFLYMLYGAGGVGL